MPNTTSLPFAVSYRGPIGIVNSDGSRVEIVAMHRGQNVTQSAGHDLVASNQRWVTDMSTTPFRITDGTASFYTENQEHMLFCTFEGSATPLPDNPQKIDATVTARFTGGRGRFQDAGGQATVNARLHLDEGFSEGTLEGGILALSDLQ